MTTLINAQNLAKMKATQESNLPETAYIQRVTITNSGDGLSEAWNTVATVNARMGEPKGDLERSVASTIVIGKVHVITLPVGTYVLDSDQIQVNGRNYIVHWTNAEKSDLTALRVIVTEA